MSLIVDEHREYLSDEVRVEAFRRAIAEVVKPGAVVLDLASGTGILGLFACEAGAARVYSVELGGMVEVARAVAAANGYADRVTVIRGMSSDVTLPERVDAIVCDQIGHFGVEAGLIEYGSDARERFLKTDGTMLPARVDLFVAPVEAPKLFDQVQFWTRRPGGFDFVPARRWAANTGYPTHLQREALLGCPARAHTIEMTRAKPDPFGFSTGLVVNRPGTLHGLGGWFSAQLSPGTVLSNGPDASPRLYRRNVFLPIDAPVVVETGDIVDVQMRVMPADVVVSWTVDVWRAGSSRLASDRKGHFKHSTLNGMLLSREDLRRMDPRFVPSLTARGIARQSVLALCDGRRTLAEIEREVHRRHPDLFKSVAEAEAFVSEVVTRYSE